MYLPVPLVPSYPLPFWERFPVSRIELTGLETVSVSSLVFFSGFVSSFSSFVSSFSSLESTETDVSGFSDTSVTSLTVLFSVSVTPVSTVATSDVSAFLFLIFSVTIIPAIRASTAKITIAPTGMPISKNSFMLFLFSAFSSTYGFLIIPDHSKFIFLLLHQPLRTPRPAFYGYC